MTAHESGTGSKYVKAKGFCKLINFKKCESKSDAQKAEHQIKQLPKTEKLNWFHQKIK
jgi:predicted GIY-YIG superfamily endonuclease